MHLRPRRNTRPSTVTQPLPDNIVRQRLDAIFDGGPTLAADIYYALMLRGVTVKDLQRSLGYKSAAPIYAVINGDQKGFALRHLIASRLGVPAERIWIET